MASIFISYRRKPSAILATLIARELRQRGIEVYLDTERMDTAGSFPTRLTDAIRESSVFVCLVGETTFDSDWVRTEIEIAHKLSKPMVPVFQESYESIALPDAPTPHIKALLEYDGILVFDIKNVYIDQSIDVLAKLIENTAAALRQSPTQTAAPPDQSLIGVNIKDLGGQKFGQYELRDLIGIGGMGAVYRAHQLTLRRDVAVKVLPPAFASQAGYAERFIREAQTAAGLEHAHIVPVYDYGNQGGINFVVMRMLTGGSLADRLTFSEQSDQSLPSLSESADVIKKLAAALDYAHSRGVIHRDIKSSNVMFDEQGSPFLVDFGIAKLMGATTSLTGTGATMGTPAYMAPEQWRGESVTPATDQYALGVMTYTMITGRMPFEAPTPFAMMHKHLNEEPTPPKVWRVELPETIKVVLDRAMAKVALERYPSMREFAQAFEEAAREAGVAETGFFTNPLPQKPALTPVTPSSPPITPSPDIEANVRISARQSAPVEIQPPPFYKSRVMWIVALAVVIIGLIGLGIIGSQPGGFLVAIVPTNTITPSDTPTETVIPTERSSPTPSTPIARAERPITARGGPGSQYPVLLALEANEELNIIGISEDGGWYQVILPDESQGWVVSSDTLVQTSGDLSVIPVAAAPSNTPTDTPTQTSTPTITPTSTATDRPTSTDTPTATSTPTNTPVDTVTPTPATPVVQTIREMMVRSGPGSQYPALATIGADQEFNIVGISEDGGWYLVDLPGGTQGWLVSSAALVRAFGNLAAVPIADAPTITPTYTPSLTPTVPPTNTPRATATATLPPLTLTPTLIQCPDALPSRLIPGGQAYVRDDDPLPVNVRSGPGRDFPRVGQIAIRSIVDVVEGPTCADGFAWYRVIYSGSFEGWIAEGDTKYFVEPVTDVSPTPQVPASRTIQPTLLTNRILASTCNVIIEDEFTNGRSTNDWFHDTRTGVQSNEAVIDDFYELRLNELPEAATELTTWGSLRGQVFGNVRIEAVISASRFSTPASRIGLWVRYQDDNNFIAIMVSSTGAYRIARYHNGYVDLAPWTPSSAIRVGDGAVNTVRVDLSGSTLDLYINGEFITQVTDSTWSEGRVAFWGSSSQVPTSFYLDYIRVCTN